jgi:hypothetical protein
MEDLGGLVKLIYLASVYMGKADKMGTCEKVP